MKLAIWFCVLASIECKESGGLVGANLAATQRTENPSHPGVPNKRMGMVVEGDPPFQKKEPKAKAPSNRPTPSFLSPDILRVWIEEAVPRILPCLNDYASSLDATAAQGGPLLSMEKHLNNVVQSAHRRLRPSQQEQNTHFSAGDGRKSAVVAWLAEQSSSSDFCTSLMTNVSSSYPGANTEKTTTSRGGSSSSLLRSLRRCPNPWYSVRAIKPQHVSWSTTPQQPTPVPNSEDHDATPTAAPSFFSSTTPTAAPGTAPESHVCQWVDLHVQHGTRQHQPEAAVEAGPHCGKADGEEAAFQSVQALLVQQLGKLVRGGDELQTTGLIKVSTVSPGPTCALSPDTVVKLGDAAFLSGAAEGGGGGGGQCQGNENGNETINPSLPTKPEMPSAPTPPPLPPSRLVSPSDYLGFLLTASWDGGFSSQLEAAVQSVSPAFPRVNFVKGDGFAFRLFSAQYKVTSFPHLLLFRDGLLIGRFRGKERSPAELSAFLSNKTAGVGLTTTVRTTTTTEMVGVHTENSTSSPSATNNAVTATTVVTTVTEVTSNSGATRTTDVPHSRARHVEKKIISHSSVGPNMDSRVPHPACHRECEDGTFGKVDHVSKQQNNGSVEWKCRSTCEVASLVPSLAAIPQALVSPFVFRLPPQLWEFPLLYANNSSAVAKGDQDGSQKEGLLGARGRAAAVHRNGGETHGFAFTAGGFGFGLVGYGGFGDFSWSHRHHHHQQQTSHQPQQDQQGWTRDNARGQGNGKPNVPPKAGGAAVARIGAVVNSLFGSLFATLSNAKTKLLEIEDWGPWILCTELPQMTRGAWGSVASEAHRQGLTCISDWVLAFYHAGFELVLSLSLVAHEIRFVVWPPVAQYLIRLDPISAASVAYVTFRIVAVLAAKTQPSRLSRLLRRAAQAARISLFGTAPQ